jgi:ACR3 family arsenite transporter
MADRPAAPSGAASLDPAPIGRLSWLDRLLPLWILLAMVGVLLDGVKVGQTSLPIALGLLLMMYPVLAKVHYGEIAQVGRDRRLLSLSLLLNWLIGPLLMFVLAWLFLADAPGFRTGLIVIGLARCIAMVLIWNDLACGDREAAALLVAINSIFQILAYALLGSFYLQILPAWLGLDSQAVQFSVWEISRAVLIFLGIPLLAGALSRWLGVRVKGRRWYETRFLPRLSPWALYGLLFTIVVMFALQGEAISAHPWMVARVALPLLLYFLIMWSLALGLCRRAGLDYPRAAAVAFTAAGNNFELAIAVSIGVWGVTSQQAMAGVIGPLIEVPALAALVYLSLWLKPRLWHHH